MKAIINITIATCVGYALTCAIGVKDFHMIDSSWYTVLLEIKQWKLF